MSTQLSRRRFLQTAGALSASGLASSTLFGHMSAMAAATGTTATDYKALVCIFLYGGNDAFNTVLPRDAISWTEYEKRRASPKAGGTSLILTLEPKDLISANINGVATEFGLHPSLTDVAALYRGTKVAVLANVGPVKETSNKATYVTNDPQYRPPGLYSHNDQQTLWQSARDNTDSGGWGGRFLESFDPLAQINTFSSVSTQLQNTNFGQSSRVSTYALTPSSTGAVKMGLDNNFYVPYMSSVIALASGVAGPTPTNLLEIDQAAVAKRSNEAYVTLAGSLPNVQTGVTRPVGPPPKNERLPMMEELEVIGRMIAMQKASGAVGRQVFFVRHDGYDTHGKQLEAHAQLLKELNDAIKYFHDVLSAKNLLNNVTTFTASDFGRQLSNNGDGTDHGWGGHHFIMGGAVNGGQIYGRVPSYAVQNGAFADKNLVEASGVMLPEVSVDQYAATLGTWMGLGTTDIKTVLPNLLGTTNLGFMKPAV
jgi:uncharacterized protein (DUF1501 family)